MNIAKIGRNIAISLLAALAVIACLWLCIMVVIGFVSLDSLTWMVPLKVLISLIVLASSVEGIQYLRRKNGAALGDNHKVTLRMLRIALMIAGLALPVWMLILFLNMH